MDFLTSDQRSERMRAIKSSGTKPELIVGAVLRANGFRPSSSPQKLPGRPDFIFQRRKAAIFVHGCFWHRHSCQKSRIPATSADFWKSKFEANVRRDRAVVSKLRRSGWHVAIVWECQLGAKRNRVTRLRRLVSWLKALGHQAI